MSQIADGINESIRLNELKWIDQCVERSRVRRFAIDPDTLVDIFSGRVKIEGADLPEDACVVNVSHDAWNMRLCVFIHSMSFPPIPRGESVPDFGVVRIVTCEPTEGVPGNPPTDSWRDRSSLL